MKKFEYLDVVCRETDDAGERFAELGLKGWELITAFPIDFGFRCLFKREIADG